MPPAIGGLAKNREHTVETGRRILRAEDQFDLIKMIEQGLCKVGRQLLDPQITVIPTKSLEYLAARIPIFFNLRP